MKLLENWSAKAVLLFKITGIWLFFLDEVLCTLQDCVTHSVSFLVSSFVQLKCKAKWLPDIFSMATMKVVLQGTPFLGPVQYDRTFLGTRAI